MNVNRLTMIRSLSQYKMAPYSTDDKSRKYSLWYVDRLVMETIAYVGKRSLLYVKGLILFSTILSRPASAEYSDGCLL